MLVQDILLGNMPINILPNAKTLLKNRMKQVSKGPRIFHRWWRVCDKFGMSPHSPIALKKYPLFDYFHTGDIDSMKLLL
jgi:hypothetical protein